MRGKGENKGREKGEGEGRKGNGIHTPYKFLAASHLSDSILPEEECGIPGNHASFPSFRAR